MDKPNIPIVPIEDEPVKEPNNKGDWMVAAAIVVLLVVVIYVVVKVL